PLRVDQWLASLPRVPAQDEKRLLLSPHSSVSLRNMGSFGGRVILLAGPEGGLAPAETKLAEACGFLPVRMGPRVLRTETAGLAALAAIQALWGDF
ncbi:MAG: RsmE family RNA methyltransferase, partial [Blastocatellia bacterium]